MSRALNVATSFSDSVRRHRDRLLELLGILADPHTSLDMLMLTAQSPLAAEAWLWQEELDELPPQSNAIAEAMKDAAQNVCRILSDIAKTNQLPTIVPSKEVQMPQDHSSLDLGTDQAYLDSASQANATHIQSQQSQEARVTDPPRSRSNIPDGTPPCSELISRFVDLDSSTMKLVESLFIFLFHVINECGDDKRLTSLIDIAEIGRVSMSFVYVINPTIGMRAMRCLTQSIGLQEFYVPLELVDYLRCLSTCVWFGSGSLPVSAKLDVTEYLSARPGDHSYQLLSDLVKMTPDDSRRSQTVDPSKPLIWEDVEDAMYKMARLALAGSVTEHPEWRPYLVARQIYAQAALLILLGPGGFYRAILDRAPKALSALIDVCRHPATEGSAFVKTSVIEAITMMLSFARDMSPNTAIHDWKLAPLLAALFAENVDDAYFHQLCDLASFMPSAMQASMMPSMVELANNEKLPMRARCRLLTTVSRAVFPSSLPTHVIPTVFEGVMTELQVEYDNIMRFQGPELDVNGDMRRMFHTRLLFPSFGLQSVESAAEWDRLGLDSQLPEICAGIFSDQNVIRYMHPGILETAADLVGMLSYYREPRYVLFIERNLGATFVTGCNLLCRDVPQLPYLWRVLSRLAKLVHSADAIDLDDKLQAITSTDQLTEFWRLLWSAMQTCMQRMLPREDTFYSGEGTTVIKLISFPPVVIYSTNVDNDEDEGNDVGYGHHSRAVSDAFRPPEESDDNAHRDTNNRLDSLSAQHESSQPDSLSTPVDVESGDSFNQAPAFNGVPTSYIPKHLDIEYAGTFFSLAKERHLDVSGPLYEYACDLVNVATWQPIRAEPLYEVLCHLADNENFVRDWLIPRAVMAKTPTLYNCLGKMHFKYPHLISETLIMDFVMPAAEAKRVEPLIRALEIIICFDNMITKEERMQFITSKFSLDQLVDATYQSVSMEYGLAESIQYYLDKLDLQTTLDWWAKWLKLMVQCDLPHLPSSHFAIVKNGLLVAWQVHLSELLYSPQAHDVSLEDTYADFLTVVFSLMLEMAKRTHYKDLGEQVWDAVSGLFPRDSKRQPLFNSINEKLNSEIRELTTHLLEKAGFAVMSHPMLSNFSGCNEILKLAYNDGRIYQMILSDPGIAAQQATRLVTEWLPEHSLALFQSLAMKALQVGSRDAAIWTEFVHEMLMNIDCSQFSRYDEFKPAVFDFADALFAQLSCLDEVISPYIFQIWRDLWLWTNYPSRLSQYDDEQDANSMRVPPQLPSIDQKLKFLKSCQTVIDSVGKPDSVFSTIPAEKVYKEYCCMIWINSLFCINDLAYFEAMQEAVLIKKILEKLGTSESLTQKQRQEIGRMIADMAILTPRCVAARIYNNLNSRAQYARPDLNEMALLDDVRVDLSEVISEVVPLSVTWISASNGTEQLYTWHVVEKALEKLQIPKEAVPKRHDPSFLEKFAQIPFSQLHDFISTICGVFVHSPNPSGSAGIMALTTLTDCINGCGLLRELVVNENRETVRVCLLKVGAGLVSNDPRSKCRTTNRDDVLAGQQFLLALMNKADDEAYSVETRHSLEKCISAVFSDIYAVMVNDIPCIASENRELACVIWGNCVVLINELLETLESQQDAAVWARETVESTETYESFQIKLLNEHKIIEALTKVSVYFDFSNHYTYPFRRAYLDLATNFSVAAHTVYKPVSSSSSNSAGDNSSATSGSSISDCIEDNNQDDDSDLMDESLVNQSRMRHQDRVNAAAGNVFRNSILGDYESNSSDVDDEAGDYDDIEELSDVSADDNNDPHYGNHRHHHNHHHHHHHHYYHHHYHHEDFSETDDDHESDIASGEDESDAINAEEEEGIISEYERTSDGNEVFSDTEAVGSSQHPEFDYEIELVLTGEDSDSIDQMESDASEDDHSHEIVIDVASSDDDSDASNPEDTGFDDTVYPSIATDGGEIMLLYGDRGVLQLLDDDVEAEIDDLDTNDRDVTDFSHEFVNQALSTYSMDETTGNAAREGLVMSLWDSLESERKKNHIPLPKLCDYVSYRIEKDTELSHFSLSDPVKEDALKDMVSSAGFSLLDRKESFVRDISRTRLVMPQIIGAITRLLFSYMNQKTREFDVVKTFFNNLTRKGLAMHPVMSLFVQLLIAAKGNLERVYLTASQNAAGVALINNKDDDNAITTDCNLASLEVPNLSSPALVCGNLSLLLESLFEAFSPSHRDGRPSERSQLALEILRKYGVELVNLLGLPLLSQNRPLLQTAASLISHLIRMLPQDESFQPDIDYHGVSRIVQVLASEESSSLSFNSITELISNHLRSGDWLPYLIKEVRRSKNDLMLLLSQVTEGHGNGKYLNLINALVLAEMRMLRLLSVIQRLYNGQTSLMILRKINFFPMWQLSFEHLTTIRKIQIVGTVASLALLEIIAIPANIIKTEYDHFVREGAAVDSHSRSFGGNEVSADLPTAHIIQSSGYSQDVNDSRRATARMAEDDGHENTNATIDASKEKEDPLSERDENLVFVRQMNSFLRQKLSHHLTMINELLKAKPKLAKGSIGALAMNYEVFNLEGKEVLLKSDLESLKAQYSGKRFILEIDRDDVFNTSLSEINAFSSADMKRQILIQFHGELGEDGGGLAREWLEILSREISDPQRKLFCPTTSGSSIQQIDPESSFNPQRAELFKFVGRIVGRAIYDRRTINLHFNRAIYKFLKGNNVCLHDMEVIDEAYYRSLVWMLNNDITDVFMETFSVEQTESGSQKRTVIDLIPDGRNIPVTEENKTEYVKLIVDHKLVEGVRPQLEALRSGFNDVIPSEIIRIFDAQELELLITGMPEIDVNDWARNTTYSGFTHMSPQVRWFWMAVRSFTDEQRAKLLQFTTGTSRVPVRGFSQLESHTSNSCFQITAENDSTDRLPTAHTCMNQLSLPRYESYKKLRKQLLLAISEGFEGFGFA